MKPLKCSARVLPALLVLVLTSCQPSPPRTTFTRNRWTPEQANAWYSTQPWLAGCNFSPSTAINQLEMWQVDSFDLPTIDRELGWAEGLGFNCARVFLHDIPWGQDSRAYLSRIDQFLSAADKHNVKIM